MLAKAREMPGASQARFCQGSGEQTGLPDGSCDAVTVGSAFHWMDAPRARQEFLRILRPRGVLLVYEYQFPKALAHSELNEWIRREFNLRWKAPAQRPRGDFETVTRCFREGGAGGKFLLIEDRRVPMILKLGTEELVGMILSQSRVLHYENTLKPGEKAAFRQELQVRVAGFLGDSPQAFDFNLNSGLFARAD